MKKRIYILLFALICMLVLAGWGGKEVRLLDSGKLIDLDKAVELAKPGGMSGDTEEAPGSDEDDDDKKTDKSEDDEDPDDTDPAAVKIAIRIRGERIFYSCGVAGNVNISDTQLKDRILSDYVSGASVTLIDDFAEAHVYRRALSILEEVKDDTGLSFKEELSGGGE